MDKWQQISMKRILIIGAGAVGQVYGYQFAQAGNAVTFFIKEKYQQDLANGLTLYNLNQDKKKRSPIAFNKYDVITTWEAVAEKNWDQIYLCISSTALQQFDFSALNATLSENTTVVMLQPGPDDYGLAAMHLPEAQLVQGMITLISYFAPLPTENILVPGVAYWLPPMAASPFNGPAQRSIEIVNTFKKSNMDATVNTNLRQMAPYPTAALMTFLTALEASEWQFSSFKQNSPLQKEMIKAQRQAFAAIATATNTRKPFWHHLIMPGLLNMLLKIAPKVVPLDLETYFQVHFTKVKDQTKLFMETYISTANQHGQDAAELIALNELTN